MYVGGGSRGSSPTPLPPSTLILWIDEVGGGGAVGRSVGGRRIERKPPHPSEFVGSPLLTPGISERGSSEMEGGKEKDPLFVFSRVWILGALRGKRRSSIF